MAKKKMTPEQVAEHKARIEAAPYAIGYGKPPPGYPKGTSGNPKGPKPGVTLQRLIEGVLNGFEQPVKKSSENGVQIVPYWTAFGLQYAQLGMQMKSLRDVGPFLDVLDRLGLLDVPVKEKSTMSREDQLRVLEDFANALGASPEKLAAFKALVLGETPKEQHGDEGTADAVDEESESAIAAKEDVL